MLIDSSVYRVIKISFLFFVFQGRKNMKGAAGLYKRKMLHAHWIVLCNLKIL